MRTSNLRLGPQFELTSHLIQAVAAGIGVGLVPRLLIEDELRNGTLTIPLDAPSPKGVAYYLFESPRRESYPPLIAFREWLVGQRA
jgi:DNA-binding transcriptional LysR family regulator